MLILIAVARDRRPPAAARDGDRRDREVAGLLGAGRGGLRRDGEAAGRGRGLGLHRDGERERQVAYVITVDDYGCWEGKRRDGERGELPTTLDGCITITDLVRLGD